MAKALLGHVTTSVDRRLIDELTYLRSRVRSLEAELAKLRAEDEPDDELNDSLRKLSSEFNEPALT